MKRLLNYIPLFLIVAALTSCNDTDDVSAIFTKENKKMTLIFEDRGKETKPFDVWEGNEELKKKSIELRDKEGNYTFTFDGLEEDGWISGNFEGKIVNTKLYGTWSADGKSNAMSIKVNRTDGPRETDPLAIEFFNSFPNIYKYVGDTRSISLYYKFGQIKHRYIGFINIGKKK
ncbi:hypothetical protein Bcop_0942 [Bacteroides coprosuis DSM 18011]|uniref:DUF4847 domain-containing protein n=1 Tax=Bacteroides coprosuis DSM 18011 TaxID=679937 RepID=F3ZU48_9BACE|nr:MULTISPECIES: DUF4847 domain-containing protein [Bacteroides]EGJ71149.1 hypothetical protein Bcop_0942 [Bacteroides coprosuis DSM 18011]